LIDRDFDFEEKFMTYDQETQDFIKTIMRKVCSFMVCEERGTHSHSDIEDDNEDELDHKKNCQETPEEMDLADEHFKESVHYFLGGV
jgi:hypothetical protein